MSRSAKEWAKLLRDHADRHGASVSPGNCLEIAAHLDRIDGEREERHFRDPREAYFDPHGESAAPRECNSRYIDPGWASDRTLDEYEARREGHLNVCSGDKTMMLCGLPVVPPAGTCAMKVGTFGAISATVDRLVLHGRYDRKDLALHHDGEKWWVMVPVTSNSNKEEK